MFNPSTYNISSSAGSVDMTYSFDGTAYEPTFYWSGSVNITDSSSDTTYTISSNISPSSSADLNNFIQELTNYGLDVDTWTTLINDGSISVPQGEADEIMEVLTTVYTESLQYGSVGTPSVTASGTLTITYGANITSNELSSTITCDVTTGIDEAITFDATLQQSAATVQPSITFIDSAGTVQASAVSYITSFNAVNCRNLSVTYSGTIDITSATINKSTVIIAFTANEDTTDKQSVITLSGTGTNGLTYSDTFTLTQEAAETEASLEFTVKTRVLSQSETTAYYFISTSGITGVTVSFNGNVSVTNHTITETDNGYQLYVYTANNTTTSWQESTITATGTTSQGGTLTDTATLRKKGVSGSISLNPSEVTVSKSAGTVVSSITTDRVNSLQAEYIEGSSITGQSISGNTLTVTYGANTTGSSIYNRVRVYGVDTFGDQKQAIFTLNQSANDASITIDPSSQTVTSTETSATYTVSTVEVSNLTVSTSDSWITGQINNNTLTVTFSANTSESQRSATITISGTSTFGDTISATAALIQEAGEGGSITINPSSRTLQATEANCQYVVLSTNITSNLSVSVTGNVNITDYHLSQESFGHYLYVTTANNTSLNELTSTFTVTGTDVLGITRTATAQLIKRPAGGSIVAEPTVKTVSYVSGSTTFSITTTNIVGDLSVTTSGNVSITSATITNGTLTVVYGANSSYSNKTSYIVVSGTDINNINRSVTITLIQENAPIPPTTYTFEFNPSSQSARTVTVSPTSLKYTIDSFKTITSTETLDYDISNIQYTGGSWPTIINIRYEDGVPYIIIPANSTNKQRTAVVTFVQDESGLTITSTITQQGGSSVEETFLPIWSNDIYSASADSFIEYHITVDNKIIYAGRAYKYPDASEIKWTINDVCSNYIGDGINFTNGIHRIPDYCKTFSVVTNQSTLRRSRFYNSWAYEDTDYWLSDPIDYRVDPRQWLPVSFLSSNSRNITVGDTSYTASASNDGWTVMTNLNNLTLDCGGVIPVTPGVGSVRNYIVDSGDYVLYYANAYGGWDSLLVKGTAKKTDNIEHLNYRVKTVDLSDFSKINYQNNITPTWSLNTGITVNGHKMYHLLESTMVYLHNLTTNEIIPVVITNSQCEYLDYKNNGKRPYFYNITVEESTIKIRK